MPVTIGLNHVATLTTDMDLTVGFYEQAFEAVVTFEVPKADGHPWMKVLDLGGGAALNVFEVPADEMIGDRRRQGGRGAIDHYALAVESRTTLERVRERLVAAGAQEVGEIQRLGDEWSLFFRDPDGMELEVCCSAVTETDADQADVELVRGFWEALERRDFDAVASYMAPDGHYVDVAVRDLDPGARGPQETAARLRLGLAPLHAYELHDGPIVASGGYVVTEHSETWTWEPGVSVTLPFTSVMQVSDGTIDRWWDYFDLATLTNAAPQWWLDHIAAGYK